MVGFFVAFCSRDDFFKRNRDSTGLASLYTSFILQELQLLSDVNGLSHIGALILEPGKKSFVVLLFIFQF